MQYLSQRLAEKPAKSRGKGPFRDPLFLRQRERILDAAERLIAERGCSGTSIEAIVKLARVSSVTFYEHFEGKEACFVAAFDRAVEETREAIREAAPDDLPWPEQIRAGLAALLAAVAADPVRARMCLVEAQMGGPALLARYEAAIDSAAPKLREGRLLDAAPRGLSDAVEEATLGGIAWTLRRRIELEGGESGVEELLPKLAEIALAPYLGEGEPRLVGSRAGERDG